MCITKASTLTMLQARFKKQEEGPWLKMKKSTKKK